MMTRTLYTSSFQTELGRAVRADLSRARHGRTAVCMRIPSTRNEMLRRSRALARLRQRIRSLECELTRVQG